MGRHRAPDDEEPIEEPSDDHPEPERVEDPGGYREPPALPADEPRYPGSFPAPRFPSRPPEDFSDDFPDSPAFFGFDEPADDPREEFAHPAPPERQVPAAEIDPADDFPDFPRRDPDPPTPPSGPPTGGHRGLPGFSGGHRNEGGRPRRQHRRDRGPGLGRRGGGRRHPVAFLRRRAVQPFTQRRACVGEKLPVAVIADPSISDQVQHLADRYNAQSAPVGDHCVAIGVKSAGSDAVVDGFIGKWPGGSGPATGAVDPGQLGVGRAPHRRGGQGNGHRQPVAGDLAGRARGPTRTSQSTGRSEVGDAA